jgi:hypothetical protein
MALHTTVNQEEVAGVSDGGAERRTPTGRRSGADRRRAERRAVHGIDAPASLVEESERRYQLRRRWYRRGLTNRRIA